MKSITLRLPDNLCQTVERMARNMNVTKSEVVREAIGIYIARNEDAEPVSFLAQASDLIGGVAGPRNLSSMAKRMKGYGE